MHTLRAPPSPVPPPPPQSLLLSVSLIALELGPSWSNEVLVLGPALPFYCPPLVLGPSLPFYTPAHLVK